MEQPEGFKIKGQERKLLRLRHAIYGLKQALIAWWCELASSLKQLGFKCLYSDAGIYICQHDDGTFAIIVPYVDDILFVGPNSSFIQSKKKLFMAKWECHDLGDCKEFLRMRLTSWLCACAEPGGGKPSIALRIPTSHWIIVVHNAQDSS
jgi:hypothetical protein